MAFMTQMNVNGTTYDVKDVQAWSMIEGLEQDIINFGIGYSKEAQNESIAKGKFPTGSNYGVTVTPLGANGFHLEGTLASPGSINVTAPISFVSGRTYTWLFEGDLSRQGFGVTFNGLKVGASSNYGAMSNLGVVTFTAESSVTVAGNIWNGTGSGLNVTGDYHLIILEGTYTEEQIRGIDFDGMQDFDSHIISNIKYSDYAQANSIAKNKATSTTSQTMTQTPLGLHGFHLQGSIGSGVNFTVTKPITFQAGHTYTGLFEGDVQFQGFGVTFPGLHCNGSLGNYGIMSNTGVVTFTVDETITVAGVIWFGYGEYVLTGDYYLIICEGTLTESQIRGIDAKNEDNSAKAEEYKRKAVTEALVVGLPAIYISGNISAATKDTKVDVSFRYEDRSTVYEGTGKLKWQGASSAAYPKKNYTLSNLNTPIEFSNWGQRTKFVLKANFTDYSQARNICCAKLWGNMVKSRTVRNPDLYVLPNGGAVDGFPCMVFLNGNYNGLYSLSTSKDEGLFDMGSGQSECILSAETHTEATQFKATTTVEEIENAENFDLEYATDEEDIGWAVTSLNNVIQRCIDADSQEDYEAIATYLDIDSAIDYYIFTVLLAGTDMMDKNYLISTFDGTKWFFSAYDLDTVLGNGWTGTSFTSTTTLTFQNYANGHRLMELILQYDLAKLKARFAALTAPGGAMSENAVENLFANYMCAIPKGLKDMEVKIWPTTPGTDMSTFDQIMNWYRLRIQYVKNELDSMT